jgi:hypothetical protein
MHTSAFKSCRFHHNGGYDGDVIVTNQDSTSKPVGAKSEIRTAFTDLVKIHKKMSKNREVLKTGRIKLQDRLNSNDTILILFADLEGLIDCAIIDTISDMSWDLPHAKLMAVAKILNIDLEHLEDEEWRLEKRE